MFSTPFWVFVCVVAVFGIVSNMVVKIVQAAKSGGGQEVKDRIFELEEDFALVEQDLEDYKRRIEILEELVTNDKRSLGGEIDQLAKKAKHP